MKYDYDIAVLGAGSAGLVVAAGGSALGAKVVLFEKDLMGGDCLNYGCVPSKSFIHASHMAHTVRQSNKYGIIGELSGVNIKKITDYVREVIDSIAPHDSQERFEGLGVNVIREKAEFYNENTIKAGDKLYTAKNIVIATGSSANIPDIQGLSTIKYYTNHNIFKINTLPRKLIVLGAGPIGLEIGQSFFNLGSEVCIIDRNKNLFNKDEPEVGPLMMEKLLGDGLVFEMDASIIEVEEILGEITVTIKSGEDIKKITGDALLVSLGRKANTFDLNLDKVGVKTKRNGQVEVNEKLQSSVKNIYAAGDATGPYNFTHSAGYQAGVVLQNALFGIPKSVDYYNIAWSTYTQPEVAHVGLLEKEARECCDEVLIYNVPLDKNDRAKAESDTVGFLKLVLDGKGFVLGATIVGNKAGELIAFAALAVTEKLNISAFNSVILPYPTQNEVYKTAASNFRRDHAKEWQMKILNKIIDIKR